MAGCLVVWSSGRLDGATHTISQSLSLSLVWLARGPRGPLHPWPLQRCACQEGEFPRLGPFPQIGNSGGSPEHSVWGPTQAEPPTSMADQFPAFFRIPEPGATNPDSALLSSLHQHTCSGPDAQRPDETVVLVLISRAASTSTKHIGWAKDWGFWPKCVGICDRLLRQVRVRHVMCHPAWPTID